MIVANRLPVRRVVRRERTGWEISPGGLVTALTPILREREGSWVGWPGTHGRLDPFTHDGIRCRPVALTRSHLDEFYHGFSNETLWPLYHDGLRTPTFRRSWWRSYVEVNHHFTQAVAAALGPRSIVWVHDYQLQLVPGMLRSVRPDLTIGFFLHIPFPAEELFARLPWRREVLHGLLGADLIGLQTRLTARNFVRTARSFAGASGASGSTASVTFDGRQVRVAPFPISIDVAGFEALGNDPAVRAKAAQLRERIGAGRRIVLGVDRLDYTKGIDVRLRAVEEVLERGRLSTDDFCMIQVAVPSRERVPEYAQMRATIEQTVGRINGTFGVPGRVAVHYLHRNLPREDLAAYYLAADVMMVTPLRDGMNLVAKEYVATRTDGGGTLILSEFAGAAGELTRAVLVNPFDIDGVATALEGALGETPRAARDRMAALRRTVRRGDVYAWASDFLGALTRE